MNALSQMLVKQGAGSAAPVANTLWQARKVAIELSASEAKRWSQLRNQKERPLTAYHVHCLVSVEDPLRSELLARCLAENWSILQLRAEVQNHVGHKRSRGGRKARPREKPSPGVALQDMQLAARRWQASHNAWFAEPGGALAPETWKLKLLANPLQLQPELSRAIEALIGLLATLAAELERLHTFQAEISRDSGLKHDPG